MSYHCFITCLYRLKIHSLPLFYYFLFVIYLQHKTTVFFVVTFYINSGYHGFYYIGLQITKRITYKSIRNSCNKSCAKCILLYITYFSVNYNTFSTRACLKNAFCRYALQFVEIIFQTPLGI